MVVQGQASSLADVTNGDPQASVLVPIFFILYVNELPELVQSSIKMFAYDTKLYHRISSHSDSKILQSNVDMLCRWSGQWLLKFNEQKCKVMHCESSNPKTKYQMSGKEL